MVIRCEHKAASMRTKREGERQREQSENINMNAECIVTKPVTPEIMSQVHSRQECGETANRS